jgi:hypothetical protein
LGVAQTEVDSKRVHPQNGDKIYPDLGTPTPHSGTWTPLLGGDHYPPMDPNQTIDKTNLNRPDKLPDVVEPLAGSSTPRLTPNAGVTSGSAPGTGPTPAEPSHKTRKRNAHGPQPAPTEQSTVSPRRDAPAPSPTSQGAAERTHGPQAPTLANVPALPPSMQPPAQAPVPAADVRSQPAAQPKATRPPAAVDAPVTKVMTDWERAEAHAVFFGSPATASAPADVSTGANVPSRGAMVASAPAVNVGMFTATARAAQPVPGPAVPANVSPSREVTPPAAAPRETVTRQPQHPPGWPSLSEAARDWPTIGVGHELTPSAPWRQQPSQEEEARVAATYRKARELYPKAFPDVPAAPAAGDGYYPIADVEDGQSADQYEDEVEVS